MVGMKPREEGGRKTLPQSLASPAPPKNSSWQHSKALSVVLHKQHPPGVHRHPTGKPRGDGI